LLASFGSTVRLLVVFSAGTRHTDPKKPGACGSLPRSTLPGAAEVFGSIDFELRETPACVRFVVAPAKVAYDVLGFVRAGFACQALAKCYCNAVVHGDLQV
jgi:hypothetical protein